MIPKHIKAEKKDLERNKRIEEEFFQLRLLAHRKPTFAADVSGVFLLRAAHR